MVDQRQSGIYCRPHPRPLEGADQSDLFFETGALEGLGANQPLERLRVVRLHVHQLEQDRQNEMLCFSAIKSLREGPRSTID